MSGIFREGADYFAFSKEFLIGDWTLDVDIYYLEVLEVEHLKGETKSLIAFFYNSLNERVLIDYSVSILGTIRIESEIPFDGFVLIKN